MTNSVVQTIKDAEVDARSLSEFISKDASFKVTRRLAPTVHTLDYYLSFFDEEVSKVGGKADSAITSINDKVSYVDTSFKNAQSLLNNVSSKYNEAIDTVNSIEPTVIQRVEDAINNTAVEGGVLADTFVVVDGSLSQRTINKGLESIADLSTIKNPKDGLRVYVKSYHAGGDKGGGYFVYDVSKSAFSDGGNVINGWVRQVEPSYFNIHNYGANCSTDHNDYTDHNAFVAMAKAIKNHSSDTCHVHFPSGTYLVGKTEFTSGQGFKNEYVFDITFSKSSQSKKQITLRSDGAILKVRDGIHYGTFDKTTKERFDPELPFYYGTASYTKDGAKVSVANPGFIVRIQYIERVTIDGQLTIDGNVPNMVLGGKYGDKGWQVHGGGLYLRGIKNMSVDNVITYDNCQDGFYIAGVSDDEAKGVLNNLKSFRNARQGMSLTGGYNITFNDCSFYDIGTPELPWSTNPRASVDIEAESGIIKYITFNNCYLGRSAAETMVADSGTSSHVTFNDCEFISDLGTVIWVTKENYVFNRCYINGQIKVSYSGSTYNDCTITDNPDRNPNFKGVEYLLEERGTTFNNLTVDIYKSGGLYSRGGHYNHAVVNKYNADRWNWSMVCQGTMVLRDKRPEGSRAYNPTMTGSTGVFVIEDVVGGSNTLKFYGVNYMRKPENTPFPYVYMKDANTIDKIDIATSDDLLSKFNLLLSKMTSAGIMK